MSSLLLTNAQVYLPDLGMTQNTALAIQGDRILAVGPSAALLAEFGDSFQVEDLEGKSVLPGLTDAHLHLETYSRSLAMVDCETATRAECLTRLAQRTEQTAPGEWVLGRCFNHNAWPDGPASAADLDAIAPNNPVFVSHKSLHSAWVNQRALDMAGISQDTPDPVGARFGRSSNGSLDGILYEANAMQQVYGIIPAPSVAETAKLIEKAVAQLSRYGLTSVHDFDRQNCFAALQMLHADGALNLRVLKSLPLEILDEAIAVGLRSGFGDDMLRIGSVKAFMDGALGPQTAAMLTPYEGSNSERGILMMSAEELYAQARKASDSGLSMAVHAIGDRAVREVLDAYTQLRTHKIQQSPRRPVRHRIEHVQLIHPQDAGRLAALDIIASMQPLHATSDMDIAEQRWGERAWLSYAWKTQVEAGAHLVFGSDSPVESPNPFLGLHAAVTRRRADGTPGEAGWIPQERLSLEQALQAYTCGPAYAAGMEDRLGKIAPGYLGDLIVLPEDPFAIEPHALQHIQPLRTMLGGRWVFRQDD